MTNFALLELTSFEHDVSFGVFFFQMNCWIQLAGGMTLGKPYDPSMPKFLISNMEIIVKELSLNYICSGLRQVPDIIKPM